MTLLQRVLDKPRTLFVRRALFQIHLWSGIICGIYAILIGVSGSILVFWQELHSMSHGGFEHVAVPANAQLASPDDWLRSIRNAAGPSGNVNINIPQKPDESVQVMIYRPAGGVSLFLNPYSSEVIG